MNKFSRVTGSHVFCLIIAIGLGLPGALFGAPQQMLPPDGDYFAAGKSDPAVTRQRTYQPSQVHRLGLQSMVTSKNETITPLPEVGSQVCYTFFPDVAYTVTVTSVTSVYNGACLVEGACEGCEATRYTAVIAADGERHEVHDFRCGKLYQAVRSAAGTFTISENDDTLRPPITPSSPLQIGSNDTVKEFMPTGIIPLGEILQVTNDLMICIDKSAQQWIEANGGGVTAFACAAVAKMNIALQNSNVGCVIRLVHIYETATPANTNLTQTLADVMTGASPFEPAAYFRNQTGADLVTVFVDTGSAYGIVGQATTPATLVGNSAAAFSVCAVRAVDNSQTMSHEIGHNLGAGHSKYQVDEPGPSVTANYAAGWYFTGTNSLDYHTIMAYNFDGVNRYYPCDYYSTPLIEWQGAQVGDASDGDNVRAMWVLKNAVANYKSRKENVTVTFNPNGGTVTPGQKTFPVGLPYGSLPLPELEGYTFLYWLSSYGRVTAESIASPLLISLTAAWVQTVPPQPYSFVNGTIYKYNGFETDVVVPDLINSVQVTAIASGAFSENMAVQTITLPQSVVDIGPFAFRDMENLREVFLPANLVNIGNSVFYACGKMTNITFHAGVRNIPSKMAYRCGSLATVTLPAGLTNIADNAFYGCVSLRQADIPAGCLQIGDYAYMDCDALTNCVMRPGLIRIGTQTFYNCAQLASADLPDSITSVGSYAFYQCLALERINIPANLTDLGHYAFHGCNAAYGSLTIPSGLTTIGDGALAGLEGITAINVVAGNPNYASVDGILFNKNKTLLIQCPGGKNGIFNIPAGVIEIGDAAFLSCRQLMSVTIPDSTKIIGEEAFKYCTGLTWIAIPASVTNLSYKAFGCCTRLKNIGFMGNRPAIGDYMFESSQQVTILVRPGSLYWGETQSGRPVVEWLPEFLEGQSLSTSQVGFSFIVANALGQDVTVIATTNLANGAWTPVASGQKQHNGQQMTFTDPGAATLRQRFYRLDWPQ